MVKPLALLIGTRENAPYHPLGPVEDELTSILTELCELTIIANSEQLSFLDNTPFRLLVCYADTWEQPLADNPLASLLKFVDKGGALLVLHNGICYQSRPEFVSLVGARFTGHPLAGPLKFRTASATWMMQEEPYRFEFENPGQTTMFCEYEHEGSWYPAAWTAAYGQGQLVYFMPGHSVEAFLNTPYRKQIQESVRWLLAGKNGVDDESSHKDNQEPADHQG